MAQEQNNGVFSVDGIQVDMKRPISPNHHVYKGKMDGENAAVKILFPKSGEIKKSKDEVRNMIDLGAHRNTVRYMGSRQWSGGQILIAMEECSTNTLENVVPDLQPKTRPIIMQHIIEGLKHIHENGIYHRMLKPRHILQSADGRNIKICGFGRSKRKNISHHSVSTKVVDEWNAPECYKDEEVDEKSDIFSAGLIFYYIVSGGRHAFGDDSSIQEKNIKQGKKIKNLETEGNAVLEHLIEQMLAHDPKDRPTVDMILKNPFFWDEEKKQRCVEELLLKDKIETYKTLLDPYKPASKKERAMLLFAMAQCTKRRPEIDQSLQAEFKAFAASPRPKDLPDSVKFDKNVHHEDIPTMDNKRESNVGENILPHNSLKIYLDKPVKEGKAVYEAVIEGIVEDKAAVKFIPKSEISDLTELIQIMSIISEHENIAEMKSNFRKNIAARYSARLSVKPEEECVCLSMEACSGGSLADILNTHPRNVYRKMLALHLIYALEHLHSNGIVHGKISQEKFLLSKNRRHLKLLPSRNIKGNSGLEQKRKDIRDAVEVLKAIIGREDDYASAPDRSDDVMELKLFNHLCDAMCKNDWPASDILKHPFFWSSNTKLDFLAAISDILNARNEETEKKVQKFDGDIRVWKGPKWSDDLRSLPDEKKLWFPDSNNLVYSKAIEYNYDTKSATHLARLIRNCAQHLLDDCAEKKLRLTESNKVKQDQTLFFNRKDIWRFFVRRFPTLLLKVYDFAKRTKLDEDRKLKKYFSEATEKTSLERID